MRIVMTLIALWASPAVAEDCRAPAPDLPAEVSVVLPAGHAAARAGRVRIAFGALRLAEAPAPCPPAAVPADVLHGDAPAGSVLHGPAAADLLRGPAPAGNILNPGAASP